MGFETYKVSCSGLTELKQQKFDRSPLLVGTFPVRRYGCIIKGLVLGSQDNIVVVTRERMLKNALRRPAIKGQIIRSRVTSSERKLARGVM